MSEENEVSVENPIIGKLKITGQNLLVILTLVAAGAGVFSVYLLSEHKAEARGHEVSLVKALEKVAESQEGMVREQRMQNCLLSLTQDKREREFTSENSFCRRVTR